MWKGLLKVLLCLLHGLEASFLGGSGAAGGVASAFHALEVMHTHYWAARAAEVAAQPTKS